jgi:hypothetical protein
MEYKPVPVNYTPVTRAADLIAGAYRKADHAL